MRIKLSSDFRDYYDFMFAPDSEVIFSRMAHDRAMPKTRQFETLKTAGLATPPFLAVGSRHANGIYGSESMIVTYTDEHLHCGQGKIRQLYSEALRDQCASIIAPKYCVPWYNTSIDPDRAISHRYLQIGGRAFWLRYEGIGGWMSNHAADTVISVESEVPVLPGFDDYVMCAIDFVVPGNDRIIKHFAEVIDCGVAIDFNTAPGLRHTGIDDILGPIDVMKLIEVKLVERSGK